MDDQRNAKSFARRGGDELGADRRPAHGQHDDGVDVAQPGVWSEWLRHARGLRQLPRDLGDLPEHVLGVESTQRRRVVERDRVFEQRRTLVVIPLLGGVGGTGFLVGVLVSEEVASVHQLASVARGCSAPAIRRPSSSSASTSSGERAST